MQTKIPMSGSATEKRRLKALYEYKILDTISEKEYDSITKIAAQICNVPVSLITFLDKDRQWFKSHQGFVITETPREWSFCNFTILDPQNVLVVPDMRVDERFSDNPLVKGEPHAVFYAGAPLVTPDGQALGSICVLDSKANSLTEDQQDALKSLAEQVMTRLELRKKIKNLSITQQNLKKANGELKKFAHLVSHDMKTPLANISMLSRSFQSCYAKSLDESAVEFLGLIDQSARELLLFVDDILTRSTKTGKQDATEKTVDSYVVINKVIALIAPPADIEIKVTGTFPKVQMNKTSLQQVFQNLITNAIKYNDKEKGIIDISCYSDNSFHHFHITDNGSGIDHKDLGKIFQKRRTLKITDRYGNVGTGIGLSTVRGIVEDNGGNITVDSKKDLGSVFKVCIPYAC
ncbi:MAG: GAF domain-containing sensor histidine kinase [Ginsengibacter sp.]